MPVPIVNSENMNTPNEGNPANRMEAARASKKANSISTFSPYLSTIKPAGIDITPQAIKKAKGKNPAIVSLKLKLDETLGFKAPSMLVKNDITKNITNISTTIA